MKSACSRLIKKEFSQIRTLKCDCGLTTDRDRNTAINILNEGLRLLAEVA